MSTTPIDGPIHQLAAEYRLIADAAQGTVDMLDGLDAKLGGGHEGRDRAKVYAEARRDTFREAAALLEERLLTSG